jgi:hypothetical protein
MRHHSALFADTKTISWQTISLKNGPKEAASTFYRFQFKKEDKNTKPEEVREFFSFSNSMGVLYDGEVHNNLIKLSAFKKAFSSADDTSVMVDVYFTPKGIDNIEKSDLKTAVDAYLQAIRDMGKKNHMDLPLLRHDYVGDISRKIMKDYRDAKVKWRQFIWPHRYWKKRRELRHEYYDFTDRKLREDHNLVKMARKFAQKIDLLTDTKNERQLSKFFIALGKSKGFDYMVTIAALNKLAGNEETLVHKLSMEGGGIYLKSIDEGKLVHPREKIHQELERTIPKAVLNGKINLKQNYAVDSYDLTQPAN